MKIKINRAITIMFTNICILNMHLCMKVGVFYERRCGDKSDWLYLNTYIKFENDISYDIHATKSKVPKMCTKDYNFTYRLPLCQLSEIVIDFSRIDGRNRSLV